MEMKDHLLIELEIQLSNELQNATLLDMFKSMNKIK